MRLLALLAVLWVCCSCGEQAPVPTPSTALKEPPPSPSATWPWPQAEKTEPHPGMTRWHDVSAEDGTKLDLLRFDFKENSHLRFGLYDQDEDDAKPFDNTADYFPRGVGVVARDLNAGGEGKVVAAWNGLFFAYDRGPGSPPNGFAKHIGPVVLRGKVYHNVGQHRWTFGVKLDDGRPVFKALYKPSRQNLAGEFDFAADGAQCLIREGKPLRLPPLSQEGEETPNDVGRILYVDFMKTSRVSIGWSRDNRYLYLLVVEEPDNETGSKIALKHGGVSTGGWALADLQRFWVKFGVWGAVNSDGGSVAQLLTLREDGKYELMPPAILPSRERMVLDSDLTNAPAGGSLLTFYISDRK